MSISRRVVIVVILLAAAVAAQAGLNRRFPEPPKVSLARPLAELPLELGPWQGEDLAIDNPRLRYADEHLRRVYRHRQTGQEVRLWMAYSTEGKDRDHHPEVCFYVSGQEEDTAGRNTIDLPGHEAPVQQFRFRKGRTAQTVYYWYYTLLPPADGPLDELQSRFRNEYRPPASLTIEMFAPDAGSGQREGAAELLALIDAEIQEFVGPTAVRGSERRAIKVLSPD